MYAVCKEDAWLKVQVGNVEQQTSFDMTDSEFLLMVDSRINHITLDIWKDVSDKRRTRGLDRRLNSHRVCSKLYGVLEAGGAPVEAIPSFTMPP